MGFLFFHDWPIVTNGGELCMFSLLFLMACQFFYNGTEDQFVMEFYKVASYNKGIDHAVRSSVLVECHMIDDSGDEPDSVLAGHGSGNYLYSGDHKFILTASHVVSNCHVVVVKTRHGNAVIAEVAYDNKLRDVAILKPLGEFPVLDPIKMNIDRRNPLIGQQVFFMGHPVELHYFLFQGIVSQEGETHIWLHSTAWAGASGSVVFSSKGRIVGTLSAVKVVQEPILGVPRVLEDMVLISKTDFLSKKFIKEIMNEK